MPVQQYNMFGPPEDVSSYADGARGRDDAPVPCERELLWPTPHAEILGTDLLERLYGDIPRRTRLTIIEVCRRLRCGHTHVYELRDCGSLDSTNDALPTAQKENLTIYRYSLVRFLFSREFIQDTTRNLAPADMQRIERLIVALRQQAQQNIEPQRKTA